MHLNHNLIYGPVLLKRWDVIFQAMPILHPKHICNPKYVLYITHSSDGPFRVDVMTDTLI